MQTYLKKNLQEIEYDVVVCGGGPAGFTAAIQAGRMGCRTALIEKYGMLGGAMTMAGITGPMSFHAFGKQIISGIGWELMTRLSEKEWAILPEQADLNKSPYCKVNVNPVMAAHIMDEMCSEANVDVYFHQPVVDVVVKHKNESSTVEGIVISTKSGPMVIKAKVVMDCTGDGDIAAWSGAEYEIGDSETNELQPGSLSFYLTGYTMDTIDEAQIDASYVIAENNGRVEEGDYWGLQFWGASMVMKNYGRNINHVTLNGADSKSRTNAEISGRKSIARIAEWIRKDVKDGTNICPITLAPEVWVRESRRIIGDEYIKVEDLMDGKIYEDSICHCFYSVDIHNNNGSGKESVVLNADFLSPDKLMYIPLGALKVKGFSNLLVAGRCISGDHYALAAYRVQASCMAMGQAAGALAALSLPHGGSVREVKLSDVRKSLLDSGAIIPV